MVLAAFLLTSCSLSPEQAGLARSLELPDLALTNATYVLDRGDDPPLSIVAGYIALYDQTNKAIATSLTFFQHDERGNLMLQGSADTATVNLTTNDALLQGSVIVEKLDQQLRIEAQQLQWLGGQEILKSEGPQEVLVIYEGNKQVRGTGLTVELATSTVTFEQVDEGVVLP